MESGPGARSNMRTASSYAALGLEASARFQSTGNLTDLSSSIEHQENSVRLTPDGHRVLPLWLSNLGFTLHSRFERTGDLGDISKAIEYQENAIKLALSGDRVDRHMATWMNNLGSSFQSRFERTGKLDDIADAIEYQQKAVNLIADDHPNKPSALDSLRLSLESRFERTLDLGDLASAIECQLNSICLTHDRYPAGMSNLGILLCRRYEITGDLDDLASAIKYQQEAVSLTPDGHPDLPRTINCLGYSLFRHSQYTGSSDDLFSAIKLQRKAVKFTLDEHPDMPFFLQNLAELFYLCFESTNKLDDLSSAIVYHRKAVIFTPDNDPEMPFRKEGLATSLLTRFRYTDSEYPADLADATEYLQQAIALTPEGDVGMAKYMYNLGVAFQERFVQTNNGEDRQRAIQNYYASATLAYGMPDCRLNAALNWANLSKQAKDSNAAFQAYATGVELLPAIVSLNESIKSRYASVENIISSFTMDGVALTLAMKNSKTALEWIELGRCLVWGQLNQLRTPVDMLREYDASLADQFTITSNALDASGSRPAFSHVGKPTEQRISAEARAHTHTKLKKQWDDLVTTIRNIPRFNDFLRPLKAVQLLHQLPKDGHIVIINIHPDRCDALALIHDLDQPLQIPLVKFSHKKAERFRNQLQSCLTGRCLMRDGRGIKQRTNSSLRDILRELWTTVVWPILQSLGYTSLPSTRGRIWWCATGPLAFLPIHAAGIYEQDATVPGPCISDFVVSSYTPTVSTLLGKLKNTPTVKRDRTKALLISQPNAVLHSPIPATTRETQSVLKRLEDSGIDAVLLEDSQGTMDRVKEKMQSHGWVHIASHASQHPTEPLKSSFALHDGKLELIEIIRQRLPTAEFAFLSACQTSVGHEKLSEEAVHLAAGILAAGYQGVVATMWSIRDAHAPKIAEDFYDFLLREKRESGADRLESGRAAYALDDAMRKIRERMGDSEEALLTWVPYIHLGL